MKTKPPMPNPARRCGKIARLPLEIRQQINSMLSDGIPYPAIAKRIAATGHALNNMNISRWFSGGYQDWLKQQACLTNCGPASTSPRKSFIMRAKRAQTQAPQGRQVIAPGKRSPARGYGPKMISSFFPSGLARQKRAKPFDRSIVGVGPPLSASGPRSGFTLLRLPVAEKLAVASEQML